MANLIKIRGLQKSYRNGDQVLQVLKDIDLDVEEGEFLAIMGPSGSGKSVREQTGSCSESPDRLCLSTVFPPLKINSLTEC